MKSAITDIENGKYKPTKEAEKAAEKPKEPAKAAEEKKECAWYQFWGC